MCVETCSVCIDNLSVALLDHDYVQFKVAWSVARSTSWTSDGSYIYPVPYDIVVLNEGNAWNPAANEVSQYSKLKFANLISFCMYSI